MNYSVEYMAALLTHFATTRTRRRSTSTKRARWASRVGVPDVNESFGEYAPSTSKEKTILFGMAAVRNVGEALVEKIVSEREANGQYVSIYDLLRRVDTAVLKTTAARWSHSSKPAPSTRSA